MSGHWRRLLVQVAILGLMVGVNTINTNAYVGVVAATILILPFASWTVFALLLWTSRQAPEIQSLHERVDDALTLALISTVAAVVGVVVLGRVLGFIGNPVSGVITVGLGYIVIEVSLPAIGFLRTWQQVYLPRIRGQEPTDSTD